MPEIRKIKRKDLDLKKYSNAINKALNYRIYAEDWYLDVLTEEKWECWVYDDYEVVMPIPLQYKLGFKFVLQPIYCQQLGVFYKEEISDELFREFEKKLHKYRVRSYCFNEENTERYNPKGEKRVNYILDLNRPYEEIKKNFSKSTKWNLKQFEKSEASLQKIHFTIQELIEFKKRISPLKFSEAKLQSLLKLLKSQEKLTLLSLNLNDEMVAGGVFIQSKNRVIYINSVASQAGKKCGAPTGILNFIIETQAGKELILDFEGSNLPQLNYFFKGFGGIPREYTRFSNFG